MLNPLAWLAAPASPSSLVFAVLSVAPKSICPIHEPATPAAMPVNNGCRWKREGLLWAVGAGLAVVGGGVAAGGLDAVDCSIGFPAFCS